MFRSGRASSARTASSTWRKSMSRRSSSRASSLAHRPAQLGPPRAVALLGDHLRRARHRRIEAREERPQRRQCLADGVAPKAGVGVGRVHGIRKRPRVAVVAQRFGRHREERTRQIEPGRQASPGAHAAQTRRTRFRAAARATRSRSGPPRDAPSRRRRSRAASQRRSARRTAPRAAAARRAPHRSAPPRRSARRAARRLAAPRTRPATPMRADRD